MQAQDNRLSRATGQHLKLEAIRLNELFLDLMAQSPDLDHVRLTRLVQRSLVRCEMRV